MAKKIGKRHHHHRRRRIGAMAMNANSPIVKYAPIILGYLIAAAPIKTAVDKALVNVTDPTKKLNDQKMIYGGMALGGAYLMFMDKGKKSVMKSVIAGVLIGAGAKNAMTSFGVAGVGGYGQVKVLNGYGQVPAIGRGRMLDGYAPQGTVNGYVPQGTLNGANVMGSTGGGNGNGSSLMRDGGSSLMG